MVAASLCVFYEELEMPMKWAFFVFGRLFDVGGWRTGSVGEAPERDERDFLKAERPISLQFCLSFIFLHFQLIV